MENSRFCVRLAGTLALALACGNASAIYKCTDAQGKTTYQQKPCESAAAQSNVGPETRPAAAAQRTAATPAAAAARPPPIATLMNAVVRCSEYSPPFAERTQAGYGRWLDANVANVQAYQRSPEYSKLLVDTRKQKAATAGRMSADLLDECKKTEEYFAQNWPPAK